MARVKNFRLARIATLLVIVLMLGTILVVAQEDEQTHTIAAGETLAGIAADYDITLASLLAANDIADPDLILPGQELVIPAEATPLGETEATDEAAEEESASEATTESDETPTARPLPTEGEVYVVQPGDILDLIAQEADVSLLAIAYTNDLTAPYALLAGQVLVIPTEPPYGVIPPDPSQFEGLADGQGGGGELDGQIHIVQPGDILDIIAQTYDVALPDLITVNDLSDPGKLMPGQVLFIPDNAPPYGAIPIIVPEEEELSTGLLDGQGGGGEVDADDSDDAAGEAKNTEEPATIITEEIYVVQAGDTILSIVAEQQVGLAALLRANPVLLEQTDLEPGIELILP
ncbi:LysM peptidoglycan-binding domain-containing protein [Chloroflexota bacterium]